MLPLHGTIAKQEKSSFSPDMIYHLQLSERMYTLNVGWFDLYGVDRLLQGDVDHDGVAASTSYLNSLVEEELKGGLPPKRIIIGGFSQVK